MTLQADRIPFSAGLWADLRGTWTTLLDRTEETSAFLSAAWIETFLEIHGPILRPFAVVWRDGGPEPVGCVLLSVRPSKLGPVPVTRSYLNASAPNNWSCEHNDVLVREDSRTSVLNDLVRIVRQLSPDEWALVGVRERLARELEAKWPTNGWNGYLGEAPYVSLETLRNSGTPYLDSLSSNTRYQIRRSARLYEETYGPPSVERADTAAQARSWLDEMIVLHDLRWKSEGERGAFAEEGARAFHRSLIDRSAEDGPDDQLRVDIVRVRFGDTPIGFLYNLRYRRRVSFFQCGLRYDDDNRLKPGFVAHTLAIEHYLRMGDIEYDFLGGEPDPVQYKRSLSTDIRLLGWLQLVSPTLKMNALHFTRELGRSIRRTLPTGSRTGDPS